MISCLRKILQIKCRDRDTVGTDQAKTKIINRQREWITEDSVVLNTPFEKPEIASLIRHTLQWNPYGAKGRGQSTEVWKKIRQKEALDTHGVRQQKSPRTEEIGKRLCVTYTLTKVKGYSDDDDDDNALLLMPQKQDV